MICPGVKQLTRPNLDVSYDAVSFKSSFYVLHHMLLLPLGTTVMDVVGCSDVCGPNQMAVEGFVRAVGDLNKGSYEAARTVKLSSMPGSVQDSVVLVSPKAEGDGHVSMIVADKIVVKGSFVNLTVLFFGLKVSPETIRPPIPRSLPALKTLPHGLDVEALASIEGAALCERPFLPATPNQELIRQLLEAPPRTPPSSPIPVVQCMSCVPHLTAELTAQLDRSCPAGVKSTLGDLLLHSAPLDSLLVGRLVDFSLGTLGEDSHQFERLGILFSLLQSRANQWQVPCGVVRQLMAPVMRVLACRRKRPRSETEPRISSSPPPKKLALLCLHLVVLCLQQARFTEELVSRDGSEPVYESLCRVLQRNSSIQGPMRGAVQAVLQRVRCFLTVRKLREQIQEPVSLHRAHSTQTLVKSMLDCLSHSRTLRQYGLPVGFHSSLRAACSAPLVQNCCADMAVSMDTAVLQSLGLQVAHSEWSDLDYCQAYLQESGVVQDLVDAAMVSSDKDLLKATVKLVRSLSASFPLTLTAVPDREILVARLDVGVFVEADSVEQLQAELYLLVGVTDQIKGFTCRALSLGSMSHVALQMALSSEWAPLLWSRAFYGAELLTLTDLLKSTVEDLENEQNEEAAFRLKTTCLAVLKVLSTVWKGSPDVPYVHPLAPIVQTLLGLPEWVLVNVKSSLETLSGLLKNDMLSEAVRSAHHQVYALVHLVVPNSPEQRAFCRLSVETVLSGLNLDTLPTVPCSVSEDNDEYLLTQMDAWTDSDPARRQLLTNELVVKFCLSALSHLKRIADAELTISTADDLSGEILVGRNLPCFFPSEFVPSEDTVALNSMLFTPPSTFLDATAGFWRQAQSGDTRRKLLCLGSALAALETPSFADEAMNALLVMKGQVSESTLLPIQRQLLHLLWALYVIEPESSSVLPSILPDDSIVDRQLLTHVPFVGVLDFLVFGLVRSVLNPKAQELYLSFIDSLVSQYHCLIPLVFQRMMALCTTSCPLRPIALRMILKILESPEAILVIPPFYGHLWRLIRTDCAPAILPQYLSSLGERRLKESLRASGASLTLTAPMSFEYDEARVVCLSGVGPPPPPPPPAAGAIKVPRRLTRKDLELPSWIEQWGSPEESGVYLCLDLVLPRDRDLVEDETRRRLYRERHGLKCVTRPGEGALGLMSAKFGSGLHEESVFVTDTRRKQIWPKTGAPSMQPTETDSRGPRSMIRLNRQTEYWESWSEVEKLIRGIEAEDLGEDDLTGTIKSMLSGASVNIEDLASLLSLCSKLSTSRRVGDIASLILQKLNAMWHLPSGESLLALLEKQTSEIFRLPCTAEGEDPVYQEESKCFWDTLQFLMNQDTPACAEILKTSAAQLTALARGIQCVKRIFLPQFGLSGSLDQFDPSAFLESLPPILSRDAVTRSRWMTAVQTFLPLLAVIFSFLETHTHYVTHVVSTCTIPPPPLAFGVLRLMLEVMAEVAELAHVSLSLYLFLVLDESRPAVAQPVFPLAPQRGLAGFSAQSDPASLKILRFFLETACQVVSRGVVAPSLGEFEVCHQLDVQRSFLGLKQACRSLLLGLNSSFRLPLFVGLFELTEASLDDFNLFLRFIASKPKTPHHSRNLNVHWASIWRFEALLKRAHAVLAWTGTHGAEIPPDMLYVASMLDWDVLQSQNISDDDLRPLVEDVLLDLQLAVVIGNAIGLAVPDQCFDLLCQWNWDVPPPYSSVGDVYGGMGGPQLESSANLDEFGFEAFTGLDTLDTKTKAYDDPQLQLVVQACQAHLRILQASFGKSRVDAMPAPSILLPTVLTGKTTRVYVTQVVVFSLTPIP